MEMSVKAVDGAGAAGGASAVQGGAQARAIPESALMLKDAVPLDASAASEAWTPDEDAQFESAMESAVLLFASVQLPNIMRMNSEASQLTEKANNSVKEAINEESD
jgi:hypothetical protein